jgi:hypothetical protein
MISLTRIKAGDDLVDSDKGFQQGCHQPPQRTSHETSHKHRRQQQSSRQPLGSKESHPSGGDATHSQLPLSPNVPEQHAEGDGDSQPTQHQGDGLDHCLGQTVLAAEGSQEHGFVGCQWVGSGR